jgi:hypothetical protein
MANNEGYVDLPEINIDLTNVPAWDGQQGPKLPTGAYTMDIVSAVQGTSKSQQPVLEVTFKVADDGEHNGVELMKKYSLQQQALGRMSQLMVAAGARLDKIRPAELVGARIIVEITHVEGQGKVDAQGNVQPGGLFCEISKERAIEVAEQPVAQPPATRKAAAAPAAAPPASTATKNGSVARRA